MNQSSHSFVRDSLMISWTNDINKVWKENLFPALNSYHPKIKYTTDVNPDKFLDTKIIRKNNFVTTEVNRKNRKLSVLSASRIPKWYKINSIISDMNIALCISSSLTDETPNIRLKFLHLDYPLWLISTVKKQMNENLGERYSKEDDYILPHDIFFIKK